MTVLMADREGASKIAEACQLAMIALRLAATVLRMLS